MKAAVLLILVAALAAALYFGLGRSSGPGRAVEPSSSSGAGTSGAGSIDAASDASAPDRTSAASTTSTASARLEPPTTKPELGPTGETMLPQVVGASADAGADSLEERFRAKYEKVSAFDRAKALEDIDFFLNELTSGSLAGKGAAPDGRTTADLKEEREWLRANPKP